MNRTLPASLDAEKGVLCSVLLSSACLDGLGHITRHHFHYPSHGTIWNALVELRDKGKPIDLLTITQLMADKNELQQIGGPQVLSELQTFLPTALNVEQYASTLIEKAKARDVIKVCEEMQKEAYENQTRPICDLISNFKEKLEPIASNRKYQEDYIPIINEIPKPVLAEEALYGIAGDIVRKIEPETESHPAAILLQLLTGLGSLIGRNPYFLVGKDRHHVNIFTTIVGDSSKGRKGTGYGYVREILSCVDQNWTKTRVMGGMASGEGIVAQLKDSEDGEVSDKRLLLMEGELAQAFQVMSRTGSTLSATLRNAWDLGFLNNMSKGEPAKATDCHISLIGHITKSELRKLMSQNDATNGLANRILWVHSERTKYLSDGGAELDFTREINTLVLAVEKSRMHQRIERSENARAYWKEIYPELSRDDVPGLWGSVTSRAEAQVVRLSLLLALLDLSERIEVQHIKAARAIWDYCFHSARWALLENLYSENAMKVLESIQNGKEVSRSKIQKEVFHNHLSEKEWNRLNKELKDVIRVRVESTAGRDKVLISLVANHPVRCAI